MSLGIKNGFGRICDYNNGKICCWYFEQTDDILCLVQTWPLVDVAHMVAVQVIPRSKFVDKEKCILRNFFIFRT